MRLVLCWTSWIVTLALPACGTSHGQLQLGDSMAHDDIVTKHTAIACDFSELLPVLADVEKAPSTLREAIEQDLCSPANSDTGSIHFPGADAVAKRGETAISPALEIIRDFRGACSALHEQRTDENRRHCFVRLGALFALSGLCRDDRSAERIIPSLVAVARDADADNKERGFAIYALASASAPAATAALGPLFLALHSQRDSMQDAVLSALARTRGAQARKVLSELDASGDVSTRKRIREALDDLKVVRYY